MTYKRLTNKNLDEYNPEIDFCSGCKYYGEPNGCNRPNGTCDSYDRFLETYNRLNELEDKIENGTLVELPCKVGDTVWYVIARGEYSTLCSTTVSRICIDSLNRMVIRLNATVRKIYVGYAQDDNAFLTKAEAEKRLEELRGKV